eukprot:5454828-Amphidinium_carterae.1
MDLFSLFLCDRCVCVCVYARVYVWQGSSNTAVVDAMIPGERVECIVAVARIRDFSTATEVLQAKVR